MKPPPFERVPGEVNSQRFLMILLALEPLATRVGKRDVLDFIQQHGGLDRSRVGRIERHGRTVLVEVPDDWAARLARSLDGAQVGEKRVSVRVVPGDRESGA